MSVLRVIAFAATIGLSALTVGFVTADRLAHSPPPARPKVPSLVLAANDPSVTGAIVQGPVRPDPAAAATRLQNGFDTERLNALMRGESLPGPAKGR